MWWATENNNTEALDAEAANQNNSLLSNFKILCIYIE